MNTNPNENLWEKFALSKRSYKIIDFPRYDENGKSIERVCIRTLSSKEIITLDQEISEAVDYSFKGDSKVFSEQSYILMERYNTRYSNFRTAHYIQKILVEVNNKEKLIFPTPDHVLLNLTQGETTYIIREWEKLEEGKPYLSMLSADKIDDMIKALADSAETDQLSFLERFSRDLVIHLCQCMVGQLSTLTAANSSLTSQVKKFIEEKQVAEVAIPPKMV